MKAGTGENSTNDPDVFSSEDEGDKEQHNFILNQNICHKDKNRIKDQNSNISNTINFPIISNEESRLKIVKYILNKKINLKIKFYIFLVSSLCTCLDGYILIFIWFNTPILIKIGRAHV